MSNDNRKTTSTTEVTMKTMGGGGPMRPRADVSRKDMDFNTLKRILSYLTKYKLMFIVICITIVLASITAAVTANSLRIIIDNYITPNLGQENPDFAPLFSFLSTIAMIYAVSIISNFIYSRLTVYISQGVLRDIRAEAFSHMQTLPLRYFDTNTTGEVMSHFTNDIDTLRQLVSQSIPQALSSSITITTVFLSMLYNSIPLTIIVIISVFVNLSVAKKVSSNSGKYFSAQQAALGKLNGYIEEMIHGQKVVKVFCHEKVSKEEFDELNSELQVNAQNANALANMLMPLTIILGIFQYVILAIAGSFLAINNIGGITLGTIGAFLVLSRNFNMPISQMSQQLNSIISAMAGAKRVFKLLDEKSEEDEGYVALVNAKIQDGEIVETEEKTGMWAWKHPHSDDTITYQKLNGEMELENVNFGYTKEKLVLKDINIKAKSGQKIALVGTTGAGKTTITNLLNRFYDINDGKIRYDGINIDKIRKPDLRRSLGVVLQDTHLFTGTVLDNIRYGNLNATDEQCIEASKKANSHQFIELLKDGYNTVISGEGESISQGQKQLLAIARAIVADPPVMILDEATSSIDTHTEAIVQKGMDTLMSGRTVFVIAHRLSTIKNSDVILVLEHGEIIEKGNHQELLEKKGKYFQLYTGVIEMD